MGWLFGKSSGSSDQHAELIEQINAWHNADEHQKIVDAVIAVPHYEENYELSGILARAYNNLAHPGEETNLELLQRALDLLQRFEMDGLSDPLWHYRIGFSLYWLDREPEALPHFEQAYALDPSDSESAQFIESCRSIIERETVVKPVDMERIKAWFDDRDLKYGMNNNVLETGFSDFKAWIELTDERYPMLQCISVWMPDGTMELRSELVDACNEWNMITRSPKVYVKIRDDGAVWIAADSYLYIATGVTDAQLSVHIDGFLRTTSDMCDFFAERFPSLVQTGSDSESNDGDVRSCE